MTTPFENPYTTQNNATISRNYLDSLTYCSPKIMLGLTEIEEVYTGPNSLVYIPKSKCDLVSGRDLVRELGDTLKLLMSVSHFRQELILSKNCQIVSKVSQCPQATLTRLKFA